MFKRVVNDDDFIIGKRDFFTTFEYREFSIAKIKVLTVISKLVIKHIWDCRTRYILPQLEDGWDILQERIGDLIRFNSTFRKLWIVSNLNQAIYPHP